MNHYRTEFDLAGVAKRCDPSMRSDDFTSRISARCPLEQPHDSAIPGTSYPIPGLDGRLRCSWNMLVPCPLELQVFGAT